MKVVSPKEMVRIEGLAYAEGASETDFMERAGAGIAHYIERFIHQQDYQEHVLLLCGKGNNGGDAFVAGRHLLKKGFEVAAIQCTPLEQGSPLSKKNGELFLKAGGFIHHYTPASPLPLPFKGLLVDGLFGTGFKGKVEEPYASLIEAANSSALPILAIDIPSGLNGETGHVESLSIRATETLFLGLPKTGFFLAEGWNQVGALRHVDFGLDLRYIDQAEAHFFFPSVEECQALLPPVLRNRHKYQAGNVIGLAGSPGMPGAAILSSYAAMRSGAGIVTLLHQKDMETALASCPPEIIRFPYSLDNLSQVKEKLNSASATFIGPGLGTSLEVGAFLQALLHQLIKPCVLDADGLTLMAKQPGPFPSTCLLTPHRGEMARLLGLQATPPLDRKHLQDCQRYAEQHQVTLILKGGPTFLFHPHHPIQVFARGGPGLAKAGTGDVLTGILAALLAQGLAPFDAAKLGITLHALAGEHVVQEKTVYCLKALDLIEALPHAFRFLNG